jgi:hypothetical protein
MQVLANRWMASLIDSPGSSEPPEPFAGSVDFAGDVDDGDEHAPSTTMATHTRVVRSRLVLRLLSNRLRATPTFDTDLPIMTHEVIDPSVPESLVSIATNDSIPTDRSRLRCKRKS